MSEDKMDLMDGMELTDDMLVGITGGYELPEYHKGLLRFAMNKGKNEHG